MKPEDEQQERKLATQLSRQCLDLMGQMKAVKNNENLTEAEKSSRLTDLAHQFNAAHDQVAQFKNRGIEPDPTPDADSGKCEGSIPIHSE